MLNAFNITRESEFKLTKFPDKYPLDAEIEVFNYVSISRYLILNRNHLPNFTVVRTPNHS